MEEAVGKRRRIGSIRGCRVSSQRGSFERGHGSTVWLVTPRAGLLMALLDGIVEWEVSNKGLAAAFFEEEFSPGTYLGGILPSRELKPNSQSIVYGPTNKFCRKLVSL